MSSYKSHSPSPLGPGAPATAPGEVSDEGRASEPRGQVSRGLQNEAVYWHRRNLAARRREQAAGDPSPSSGGLELANTIGRELANAGYREGLGASPDTTLSAVGPGITLNAVDLDAILGAVGPNTTRSIVDPAATLSVVDPNTALSVVGRNTTLSVTSPDTTPSIVGRDIALTAIDHNTTLGRRLRASGSDPSLPRFSYVETEQGGEEVLGTPQLLWAPLHPHGPDGLPYYAPLAQFPVFYNWAGLRDHTGRVPMIWRNPPPTRADSPSRLTTVDEAGASHQTSHQGRGEGSGDDEEPWEAASHGAPGDAVQNGLANRPIGDSPAYSHAGTFAGSSQETLEFVNPATEPALLLSVGELRDHYDGGSSPRLQDTGAIDQVNGAAVDKVAVKLQESAPVSKTKAPEVVGTAHKTKKSLTTPVAIVKAVGNPERDAAAGSVSQRAVDVMYDLRSGYAPSSLSNCSSSYIGISLAEQSSAPPDIHAQIAPANDMEKPMDSAFVSYSWTGVTGEAEVTTTWLRDIINQWREKVPNHLFGSPNLDDGPDVQKFTALVKKKSNCNIDQQDLAFQTPYVTRDTAPNPGDAGEMRGSERKRPEHAAKQARSGTMPYVLRKMGPGYFSPAKTPAFEPDLTCYLRPAGEKDVGPMQAIYNHEVKNGTQSRDVGAVTAADLGATLEMCKASNLPFIAAIAGLEHDLRGNKPSVGRWQTPEPARGTVLGFAFLSNHYVGLCGATNSTGNSAFRLSIVVHQEHRYKCIGHALMDKMLHLVCPDYVYQDAAAFIDHEDSPSHRDPGLAPGRFRHIFVEVMVPQGDQQSSDNLQKVLKDRFGFARLFELKQSHKHKGSLYNLVTWYREARPAQSAQ
ncbi:hypothetical protein RB595_009122 [Gaeumannomyces hyphopodioides]